MQAIQDLLSDVGQVSALVVDLDGVPLTEVSNPCRHCQILLHSQSGQAACQSSWKEMARQARAGNHRYFTCHAGVQYVTAPFLDNEKVAGYFQAGEFFWQPPDPRQETERAQHLANTHHWCFHERGIRDRVELVYATPLPGAFTKPTASWLLGELLSQKKITVEPEFMIEHADPEAKKIVSYDEREIEYDLLVSVPLNKGADVVGKSGLGDELNFSPVNQYTHQLTKFENIFVLGDASNAPTSKAGSVAHFSIDVFGENFVRYIEGLPLLPHFDGHANCFIKSGFGKALLIDFNYTQEPLPGRYPLPGVGPFTLLEESEMNHWGKLMFRWVYWNVLLKGQEIPLPAAMSMAGKWKV